MIYLVCFDVSNNKLRRNLIKCLEEFGRRIQFSVFELEMSDVDLIKLNTKIKSVRLETTDKCFIFPISEIAFRKSIFMGQYSPIERTYVF